MGGGRRDEDRLDVVGRGDVADVPVRLEGQDVDVDGVVAEGLEGQRADEGGRGRGHQNADVRALVLEQTEQLDGLVCGDRARDPEGDAAPR